MKYRHFFFDLDGTLLDTIVDIANAISDALGKRGFDRRYDRDSAKALIGNGSDALLHRALAGFSDDPAEFEALKKEYMPLYKAYQGRDCYPFPHMEETLQKLVQLGADLVVVTNKPEHLSKIIISEKLPQIPFKFVLGQVEGNPVKPDPYLINIILKKTGWNRDDCVFVGDSHVDLETGANAKMKCALCTWGYDLHYDALLSVADHVLNDPRDLLDLI